MKPKLQNGVMILEQLIVETNEVTFGQVERNEIQSGLLAIFDDTLQKSTSLGIPTGIKAFDFIVGGLQESNYMVVAGGPCIGKKALAFPLYEGLENDRFIKEPYTGKINRIREYQENIVNYINCRR